MTSDTVLIYKPEDVKKYVGTDGPKIFLNRARDINAPDFHGQFKCVGHVRSNGGNQFWNYAGLMYLRDVLDNLDPLAKVEGESMIEGFNQMARTLGAKVLSSDFSRGMMELEAHVLEDYGILGWSLVPDHRDYGLTRPQTVNRLILNLAPDNATDAIIERFLESKGYKGRFKFVTIPEISIFAERA